MALFAHDFCVLLQSICSTLRQEPLAIDRQATAWAPKLEGRGPEGLGLRLGSAWEAARGSRSPCAQSCRVFPNPQILRTRGSQSEARGPRLNPRLGASSWEPDAWVRFLQFTSKPKFGLQIFGLDVWGPSLQGSGSEVRGPRRGFGVRTSGPEFSALGPRPGSRQRSWGPNHQPDK